MSAEAVPWRLLATSNEMKVSPYANTENKILQPQEIGAQSIS